MAFKNIWYFLNLRMSYDFSHTSTETHIMMYIKFQKWPSFIHDDGASHLSFHFSFLFLISIFFALIYVFLSWYLYFYSIFLFLLHIFAFLHIAFFIFNIFAFSFLLSRCIYLFDFTFYVCHFSFACMEWAIPELTRGKIPG